MELIQIIESTVFIFSLGLIILSILSYLLFKAKNHSVIFPRQKDLIDDDVVIVYEKPEKKEIIDVPDDNKTINRFIVVNEVLRESSPQKEIRKKQEVNSRFYIYKPGRNKIIKNLELSRIKN